MNGHQGDLQLPLGPSLTAASPLGVDGAVSTFDCVIVGSGFGASVFAARLAATLGPGRLAVLERGPELRPGEFPRTRGEAVSQIRTEQNPLGIFDFHFSRDLDALVGNVLGGGSQLYAGVTLEPLPQTFDIRRDPADPRSPRAWPSGISATTLRPYFDRVRGVLEVENWIDRDSAASATRFDPALAGSWAYGSEDGVDSQTGKPLRDHSGREVARRPPLRRTAAFDRAAAGAGLTTRRVPLAINLTRHHGANNNFGTPRRACTGCGDCVTGCNVGAKNALTANYLPAAVSAGAEIYTGAEVMYVRPSERPGYRWALLTKIHDGQGRSRMVIVHTRIVVLGAGVFGTGRILFASRRHGLSMPTLLGSRVSGNGDAIMLATRWSDRFARCLPEDAVEEAGPTITRMSDLRQHAHRRHLVQDSAVPQPLTTTLERLIGLANPRHNPGLSDLDTSLVMLTMGYDSALGQLVERRGRLEVHWPAAGRDPVQLAARSTVTAIAAAAGSSLMVNPRLGGSHAGPPITVHPLGGTPMGSSVADGVVDDAGRLFRPGGGAMPGFYIVDASVIPASVGANPSLTIAALAERAAETIIAEDLERLLDRSTVATEAGMGAIR